MTHRSTGPSRVATATGLAVMHGFNGATQPAWAPYTDDLVRTMDISKGTFGLVLTGQSLGLLLGNRLSVAAIERLGTRAVIAIGAGIYWCALPVAGLMTANPWGFFAVLVVSAFGNALFDVAWGQQNIAFEEAEVERADEANKGKFSFQQQPDEQAKQAKRRWHVGVQAVNSVGGLIAAAIATWAQARGVPLLVILAAVGVLAVACSLAFAVRALAEVAYRDEPSADGEATDDDGASPFRDAVLWGLAGVCFLGGLILGSSLNWAAVLLREIDPQAEFVGLGVVAFSLFGIVAQLVAWRRFPDEKVAPWPLATGGAVIALAGGLVVVLAANTWTAVVGLGLLGAGSAVTWPYAQTVAGRRATARAKSRTVALVTISMYLGISANAVLGVLADFMGMQRAFWTLIPAAIVIAVLAATAMRVGEPEGRHFGVDE